MKPTQKKQSQYMRDSLLMAVLEFLDPAMSENNILVFVKTCIKKSLGVPVVAQ